VITIHQRHRQTDRQTDRRMDVKRSHDRYIAKACSGKKWREGLVTPGVSSKTTRLWFTVKFSLADYDVIFLLQSLARKKHIFEKCKKITNVWRLNTHNAWTQAAQSSTCTHFGRSHAQIWKRLHYISAQQSVSRDCRHGSKKFRKFQHKIGVKIPQRPLQHKAF